MDIKKTVSDIESEPTKEKLEKLKRQTLSELCKYYTISLPINRYINKSEFVFYLMSYYADENMLSSTELYNFEWNVVNEKAPLSSVKVSGATEARASGRERAAWTWACTKKVRVKCFS